MNTAIILFISHPDKLITNALHARGRKGVMQTGNPGFHDSQIIAIDLGQHKSLNSVTPMTLQGNTAVTYVKLWFECTTLDIKNVAAFLLPFKLHFPPSVNFITLQQQPQHKSLFAFTSREEQNKVKNLVYSPTREGVSCSATAAADVSCGCWLFLLLFQELESQPSASRVGTRQHDHLRPFQTPTWNRSLRVAFSAQTEDKETKNI
jgi:hypothetical protein